MKVIGWVVGIVLVAVLGAVAYLFLFAGDVVERGIERFGPEYLGAPVEVSSVDIDFAGGAGSLSGFAIGNPKGYEGPFSMRVGKIGMTLDTDQSSSDLIVIKSIAIDGAELAAVAVGKKTNLQQIMDNIKHAAGSTPAEPEAGGEPMRFIVDRFTFDNAKVALRSDLLGEKDLEIPPIRLTGVGRKTNGATAVELAEQLLQPISQAVTKAAVSEGVDLEGAKQRLIDKLGDKVPGADKLKDLF